MRGVVTLILISVFFALADLTERTVVALVIWLRPGARDRILDRWILLLHWITFGIFGMTLGHRLRIDIRVPYEPGVLVLMNHQSLMDIPILFHLFDGHAPRIVTRRRYARGIPLVSHMLRLYDHPLVEPGENVEQQVIELDEMAKTTDKPVAIFPEGGRSRDGKILKFKKAGVKAILDARKWDVYVVVIDGLWRCTSIGGFVRNMGKTVVQSRCVGPFEFSGSEEDTESFITSMREVMCDTLDEIRGTKPEKTPLKEPSHG